MSDHKCKTCGVPIKDKYYNGLCLVCYEVEKGLEEYLGSEKGRKLAKQLIAKHALMEAAVAAEDMDIDLDELERYADRLQRTKDHIVERQADDIEEWINNGDTGDLRMFLANIMPFGNMTVTQLKQEYAQYFEENPND